MGTQKDIRYTEPAQEAIEKAQLKYKKELEDIIREQKFVPGEEFLEITASDIERATEQVHFISKKKSDVRELIIDMYMVLGGFTVVLGLFFDQIRHMMENDPIQFMLVIMGGGMIAASALSRWIFMRRKQYLNRDRSENR